MSDKPALTRHVIPRDIWEECEEGADGAVFVDEHGEDICCYITDYKPPHRRLVGTNRGRSFDFVQDGARQYDAGMAYVGKGVSGFSRPGVAHYIRDAIIVEYRNGDEVVARVVDQ